jgi:biopolymer transport protein ExbB/TolQ
MPRWGISRAFIYGHALGKSTKEVAEELGIAFKTAAG